MELKIIGFEHWKLIERRSGKRNSLVCVQSKLLTAQIEINFELVDLIKIQDDKAHSLLLKNFGVMRVFPETTKAQRGIPLAIVLFKRRFK